MQSLARSLYRRRIPSYAISRAFARTFRQRDGQAFFSSIVPAPPPASSPPGSAEAMKESAKNHEKEDGANDGGKANSEPPFFSSPWWSKHGATLAVGVISGVISGGGVLMTTQGTNATLKQKDAENKTKHEEHYISQVMNYLKTPYRMTHDRVADIPGLSYVARDKKRKEDLTRIMSSPGGLTLLEGPSGCGKTTTVQHCLAEMRRPGVYFSVLDDMSGLPPLASLARAFGVTDLPTDICNKALDILSEALKKKKDEARSSNANEDGYPPVLVVDDVQQLLNKPVEDEGGKKILEWCLGRAANGELTVLFISSETVKHKMKQLSGFAARLSTPDTPFDCICPEALKPALMEIKGENRSFQSSEVDPVLSVIGTHMSDLRGLQRLRTERALSIEQALEELKREEARALTSMLVGDLHVLKGEQKLRSLVTLFICREIAAQTDGQPVSLNSLMKLAEKELHCKLREPFREAFKSSLISSVVAMLVEKNVLRRSLFMNTLIDEGLAFHRPVKRCAFLELQKTEEFQRIMEEVTKGVFIEASPEVE